MAVFPSLVPRLADDLWFSIDKRLDDDAALTKEEDEYTAQVRRMKFMLGVRVALIGGLLQV